eukprot:Tbor_TRINITY_DN5039_c0_g1::TRINITY_DN5039_c0_g1_i1::g.13958::m.13958
MSLRKTHRCSYYKQVKLVGGCISDDDPFTKTTTINSQQNASEVYKIDRSILVPIVLSTLADSSTEATIATRYACTETLAGFVTYVIITAAKLKAYCMLPKESRLVSYDDVTYKSSIKKQEELITKSFIHIRSSCPSQLSVVIVGCGSVGSVIASKILSSNIVHPTSLYLMTRQPHTLCKFAALGVRCGTLNEEAVERADVIIIATQPEQLQEVSKQLKGHITPPTIVVSLCVGVPVEKVCSLFEHPLTLSTDFLDMNRLAVIARNMGLRVDCQCMPDIIDCVLPFSSVFSAENFDDSSIVSSPSFEALLAVLDQLAFVLASSATAQGMSYPEATFASWGCLTTEDFRNTWSTTYRDHTCPNAVKRPSKVIGIPESCAFLGHCIPNTNINSPRNGPDALRYAFSGCRGFCSLIGASEVPMLKSVREKLHKVIGESMV